MPIPLSPDPEARAELFRLLSPVVDDVADAVGDPPRVAAGDWLGPASRACEHLQDELRGRLGVLLAELDRAVTHVAGAS
jgi:hypothetical protein